MKPSTLLIIALLFGACSTSKPPAPPPQTGTVTEAEMAAAQVRVAQRMDVDTALAANSQIHITHCDVDGEHPQDGAYTCGCGALGNCFHGACEASMGKSWVNYWFPRRGVIAGTKEHEACHRCLVGYWGIGGHPATVTHPVTGKELNVRRDLIDGARWPAWWNRTGVAIWRQLEFPFTDRTGHWGTSTNFACTVISGVE